MDRLHIFRAGTHTASSGQVLSFSAADLAATAAAYDPAKHEAPIVVGHPRENAPAYGWVKALCYADHGLEAQPDQVDPAFAELVRAGRYKKISASFFAPEAPGNPAPGVYYLRHVGFLGAAVPAVKGLREPKFSADEAGVVEFGDYGDSLSAGLWQRLREWIISRFGLDEADKVLPGYDVEALKSFAKEAPPASDQPALAAYAEPAQQEISPMPSITPEQLASREAELNSREARVHAAEAELARNTYRAFAERLVTGAQIAAAEVAPLVELMACLQAVGEITFAESGATQKVAPVEWLQGFLTRMPARVEFGEVAGGAWAPAAVEFNAPQGASVDTARLQLHYQALAYQREHTCDYASAARAVGA